jgi:hypothetical protein
MALTTARISSARWRPPGLGGGIKGWISSHSASVRSVGYGVVFIPRVYRTDTTYGGLFKQPLSGASGKSLVELGKPYKETCDGYQVEKVDYGRAGGD